MKSKVVEHRACPSCREEGGDKSGNNLAIYEDGTGYCFACQEFFPATERRIPLEKLKGRHHVSSHQPTVREINTVVFDKPVVDEWRGITPDTFRTFGVLENDKRDRLKFPYGPEFFITRDKNEKKFRSFGTNPLLFGQLVFNAGSAEAVTVTEGALDAMSVYQMLGSRYPAVSVRSAATAESDCKNSINYLNSFNKIYLCFDNDKPGKEACEKVAKLFDINKIHIVPLTNKKDPNEFLTQDKTKEFVSTWWNARRNRPSGIISSLKEVAQALETKGGETLADYPFKKLQEMTYGIRSGEVVLLTAQEKVGKTSVMRVLEHHFIKNTDHNIGIIHIEETEKDTIQGLVSQEMQRQVHLPDSGISNEEKVKAYGDLVGKEDRVYIYSHYGSDDANAILDVVRYLVAVLGCRIVFLDHITMVVTGFEADDNRKKLDYISTKLSAMAKELDFCLVMVSHVNDDGKTRDSRNISKVAHLLLHLDRDIENPIKEERNCTYMTIRGNRFYHKTGPASRLMLNEDTGCLEEIDESFED